MRRAVTFGTMAVARKDEVAVGLKVVVCEFMRNVEEAAKLPCQQQQENGEQERGRKTGLMQKGGKRGV